LSRCWLAIVDAAPKDATAIAELEDDAGARAGVLVAWFRRSKPVRNALRADSRIVDPAGPAGWASLVLVPPGVRVAFDDLAVQQARRDVLAHPRADAVSTLLRDASHFEGAITLARGEEGRARLRDDPFARVFPARMLRLGPGIIGAPPAPVGPTIERYGSANPWPWDRFG
jgi:hypothetical protein